MRAVRRRLALAGLCRDLVSAAREVADEVTYGSEVWEASPVVRVVLGDGREVWARIDGLYVERALGGIEGCTTVVVEASEA